MYRYSIAAKYIVILCCNNIFLHNGGIKSNQLFDKCCAVLIFNCLKTAENVHNIIGFLIDLV